MFNWSLTIENVSKWLDYPTVVYRGAICGYCHSTGRWLAAQKAEKHAIIIDGCHLWVGSKAHGVYSYKRSMSVMLWRDRISNFVWLAWIVAPKSGGGRSMGLTEVEYNYLYNYAPISARLFQEPVLHYSSAAALQLRSITFRLCNTIVLRWDHSTKHDEKTETDTGTSRACWVSHIAVMANKFWNVAVTRKDTLDTGYLPTLAGR